MPPPGDRRQQAARYNTLDKDESRRNREEYVLGTCTCTVYVQTRMWRTKLGPLPASQEVTWRQKPRVSLAP